MSTVTAPRELRWCEGVASPGVPGYVLVHLLSSVLVVVPLAAYTLWDGSFSQEPGVISGFGGAMAVLLVGSFYAVTMGAPAALVGCFLAHVGCARTTDQRLHVLALAAVGLASGVVYGSLVLGGWWGVWFWLDLGCATALGRAAVIPLAGRRWHP